MENGLLITLYNQIYMKVLINTIKNQDMGYINGVTAIIFKELLMMTRDMEKVKCIMQMEKI